MGSMVALAVAARAAGKTVSTFVPDSIPPRYDGLVAAARPVEAGQFDSLAAASDLIVILDTCAFSQLDGLEEQLRALRHKIVVVDHHATADDVGEAAWMDASAAATGVMVTELLARLAWPIDLPTAELLMTAITTDTGWLRFANTDARCLRVVADLIDAGVRPDRLYRKIFQADRPQRLALVCRALATLELHCGGKVATMMLRREDFAACDARYDETENIVNEAMRLKSVETSILLVEDADCVRVSLRSRDDIDVSQLAGGFGGGGHKRAAGLRSDENIDMLKDKLIAACTAALG